jgi:hypothetical protein
LWLALGCGSDLGLALVHDYVDDFVATGILGLTLIRSELDCCEHII